MANELGNLSMAAEEVNREFSKSVWPVSLIVAVFSAVGILGNVFVLYVHIFKYPTCNFRYFVLGLCAVDLVSSLTILPLEVYTQLHWFVFPYAWLCKLKAFLHVFLSVCSVYVLLLIAVDRYRKVCAPHAWQVTLPLIWKGYVVSLVVALLQAFPVTVVWGLNEVGTQLDGHPAVVSVCTTDPKVRNTAWPKVFLAMIVPHIAAMVAMVVMYTFVAHRIFGVVQNMRKKSAKKKRGTQMAANNEMGQEDDDEVFGESGPHSDSVIDSKLREGITEPLNGNKNVKMVAYRVCNNGIMCERGNSLKKTNSNVKLTFEDLKKLEETSPRKAPSKSESSAESYRMTEDSRERTRSRGYSTASTIHESTEDEVENRAEEEEEPGEKKPFDYATDTLRSITKSLRRKSLFQKKVRFSKLARDKLKRRTLITFVFTAIYILTTITYIIISGHVTREAEHALSMSHLAVLLFFFRLYFINNVIHPIIYGALDPRFRKTLRSTSRKILDSVWRSHPDEEPQQHQHD